MGFVPVGSLLERTAPPVPPAAHGFRVGGKQYLLIPEGSRVFELDRAWEERIRKAGDGEVAALVEQMGIDPFPANMDPPDSVPLRSLSLAIAQKCNLACTYCYAEHGGFGERPQSMPKAVALRSVEALFAEADANSAVTLAFMGGEPLTNREVLREAAEYAAKLGMDRGVRVKFSITTNATLLTPEDGEFFERFGFAVTVSLDGAGEAHDRQRPFAGGRGTYAVILERLRPILAMQRRMQVSARVTVTPAHLELRETLDEFTRMGFASVGFSPMLASPNGSGEMDGESLRTMLGGMIECGMECEKAILADRRYPFANLVTALEQIHRGTHRPYPCGAGAGYFGVSANGGLYACHRFVNDPGASFGSISGGPDRVAQKAWLAERHVGRQEPCRSCWARYLCGGGCHHEVIRRGRQSCEYIKGWLDYCLKAYVRLLTLRPDYFGVDRRS